MTIKSQHSAIGKEALEFHSRSKKGKLSVYAHKPLKKQKDLSLAYSPGVAAPCIEIQHNPGSAFDYTSKGNFVAVITNGTAVLGLGNLGALASKPVMEGKAALFKRFADIDAIDIEVDTQDPETFIQVVKHIALTWGGINLEDIKAPECFIIEQKLKELVDVPVFHDDQHGTAIVTAAGLVNAAHVTGRNFQDMKIVVNGAGAAAIACIELLKTMGMQDDNVIMCDTQGVIYKGRTSGMNQWKEKHANKVTNARTLAEALVGADIFLGLSVKNAVTKEMILSMSKKPIVFAMANPDPEITPEEVFSVCPDAITATGRSDYHNQVNNVMCFPYIFRGALDTQATTINEEMKIAAVHAIATLARQDVSEEVVAAYPGRKHKYGHSYIIPTPFDSRLIQEVSAAVAEAAMKTGVASKQIDNIYQYKRELAARLNPGADIINRFFATLQQKPQSVIFAHGEEEQMIKAAMYWQINKYGKAILVGKEHKIKPLILSINPDIAPDHFLIIDPKKHHNTKLYADDLYARLQRSGLSYDDCVRLLMNDSTVFATEMLKHREADAMVAGLTEGYLESINKTLLVTDKIPDQMLFALAMMIKGDRVIFIADIAIHEETTPKEMAQIAIQAARAVKQLGHIPRVAFVSSSTFGQPNRKCVSKVKEALSIMDEKGLDFEYDGDLAANVAINSELLKLYPFCRLSGPANILITPDLGSAHISYRLLEEFGEATVIGPVLCGLGKSVQIVRIGATAGDILDAAAVAAARDL